MIENDTHKRQSVDWALIGVYILLVLIGWVNIYAAVHSENPASIFAWESRAGKQFVCLAVDNPHFRWCCYRRTRRIPLSPQGC